MEKCVGREKERERKKERERACACTRDREYERKRFGSSFYKFFPPPGPALGKLGLARSAVCSAWSLHSGPSFDLPCLLATAILDSFSLFYLPNIPPSRWEAQFFGNRGVEVFLATSCWTGVARDIGPPPIASLNLQSPYSGVQGCVIFSVVSCSFISLLNWHCML